MSSSLVINNLTKVINKVKILDDINLEIFEGEIVGIVGFNGSGKSTLFKCILGLYKYEGEIIMNGNTEIKEEIKNVGFMIENPSLFNEKNAFENLKYWAKFYNVTEEWINEVLTIVGLRGNNKKVKNYSLGMKQKLSFAISILHNPSIIILDEPTNALDLKSIVKFRNILLSMRESIIIIASHDVNELSKICNKLVLIRGGKIIRIIDKLKYKDNIEKIVLKELEAK